jgi:GNAT superfamily N-acetyltransferase
MSLPRAELSGAGEASRIQENLIAYFLTFAGLPGVTVAEGDVTWFVSARGAPGNYVLRAQLSSDSAGRRIDEAFRQVSHYGDTIDWLVFPGCQPADLGAHLEARGMKGGPGGTWMLADLASPPGTSGLPDDFRASRVRDAAMLEEWKVLSTAGFETDAQIYYDAYIRHDFEHDAGWLHYIGYHEGEPVTSSTLLLAGGIAGIYDISTPPSFRGHGYGRAITLAMMQEARRLGYQDAWIWSSEMGKGVYSRVGFVARDLGIREYRWEKPTR